MLIKVHLSGVAIAYEPIGNGIFTGESKPGRVQGSRYNQQKRKIADAVEYMRLCGKHKPVIFVATSPGYIPGDRQKGYIKALTHYLRNSCDCRDYAWVREQTKKGFPHYHFVADMPFPSRRDDFRALAIDVSRYWSSLFGVSADNSVRFGTKPPKRKFFVDSQRMAFYISKYVGKNLGETTGCRRYDISKNARDCSGPLTFQQQTNLFNSAQVWEATVTDPDGMDHSRLFNPHSFDWRKCKDHWVWIGRPKSGKEKSLKSTVQTQKIAATVG